VSLVLAEPFQDGAAFSTPGNRAKYRNVLRNPKCSLLVSTRDWFSGYVVLEGEARVMDASNTEPAVLSATLRDVYRATADPEHPDWDEFDEAMVHERRAVIIVVPESAFTAQRCNRLPGAPQPGCGGSPVRPSAPFHGPSKSLPYLSWLAMRSVASLIRLSLTRAAATSAPRPATAVQVIPNAP
jgi:hypothetical protein